MAREAAPKLLRLVYVSEAAGRLAAAELDAIAAASQRNNAARGLTGLLLFGDPRFYGVLEGPRRRVLTRMERIITDPRHRGLLVIAEETIEAPRFANWSFGQIPARGQGPEIPDALDSFIFGLVKRL